MADQKVKLEAVISATSQGMVDALKRASAAVNDSTASWKERFANAKGNLSTVSEAVKNLTSAVGQMGEIDIKADPTAVERIKGVLSGLEGVFGNVRGDVESLSSALVAMRQEASVLGMPVVEYQRFGEAVQAAGMDVESAGQMIERMRSMIQGFANGVPEAVDLFGRLGITLERLGSNSPVGNLQIIAEAIRSVVPASEQATVAAQSYGRSLEEVTRIAQEYSKVLSTKGDAQYASDRDIQGAISLAQALSKVGESLDGVAGKLNGVNASGDTAVQTGMRTEAVFRSLMDALDAYNRQLSENATAVYSVDHAYQILMQDIGRLSSDARKHSSGLLDDASFNASIDGMAQNLSVFSERLRTEMDNLRAYVERNVSIGAPVDISAVDKALAHLNTLSGAMVTFDRVTSASGRGRERFDEMGRAIQSVRNELGELRSDAVMSNLAPDVLSLQSRIDDMAKSLDNMMKTPVKLRTEVDLKGIDELKARLAEIRSRANQVLGTAGNTGVLRSDAYRDALKPLEDGLAHIDGMLHVLGQDAAKFNDEVRRGVPITTAMGNLFRWIGNLFNHPIEKAKQLWQWMTRFKSASSDAGRAVDTTGKQLSQVAGMLTGMGSKVMIIVKGFRVMADAVKEIAKWWTEAEKRRAEFNSDLAKDATSQFQANRKEAEDRMMLSQKYAEAVSKANRSGKAEDRASAEVIRKELWEKHAVRVNPDTARKVFREQSESYYDTMVSQNESETNMYRELVTQYRKALEERKKYIASGLMEGTDLSQKIGEDTVYTDLMKKLGDAQKRLGELTVERTWLGRKRRGGEYADYVAVNGGMNDDAMREMIRKEDERRDKLISDREKAAEEAAGDLSDWSAQVTMDDVDRQIRDVWKKYNDIVKAGGDRQKAYQVAVEAIRKIREEAERKEADELKKLADEHEHQVESLQRAREQEQDAQKRLLESYKALYEAQENEAYRIRLEDIGKAHERLRKKMDRFGFTLPDGFKSSRPNLSSRERRTIRMDDRIADKLARRQAGERVHFSNRELERIRELEKLMKRDKSLSAEERQIRAAQTQASAAKTMKSATEAFYEAVKKFFEAQTGKKLETEKERKARERKERRERARSKNEERRRPPEQKGESRPSGRSPSPAARADGSKEEARPAGARPGHPSSTGNYPPVFLDWESYLAKFKGSPQDAAEYYRKYVEMFNRMHGTSHEYKVGEFPNPYPEPEKQSGGVKLPPEYDDATRHQRAVAEWNRRNHPDDYDDEGNWKYSENGMARERDRMQADAVQEPVDKVVQPVDTVEQPVEQKVQPVGTTVQPVERKIQPVEARTQPVEEVEQPVQRIEQPVETRTMPVEQAVQPVDTKTQPVDVQTQPVDTVKQPVEEKKQPVESKTMPVEARTQPVDVKTMPVDTVTQPVEVAVQPVETRTMPVDKAVQPVEVVEQPVSTQVQPVASVEQPVQERIQPVGRVVQPVEKTTMPVEQAVQPVETKVQPVEVAEQPVDQVVQPVETVMMPVEKVVQPVEVAEQPVDTQTQPVATETQPVDIKTQPVEQVEQPVEVRTMPVASVLQPVDTVVQPVDTVEQPVETKTMPVNTVTQPVEQALQPVDMVKQPVEVKTMPVDQAVQPVQIVEQPVASVEQPVQTAEQPVQRIEQPVQVTEQPVQVRTMPVETVTQPVDQVVQHVEIAEQPVETKTQPVEVAEQPVQTVEQPVQVAEQPVEVKTMPVEQVVQPVATVEQPVASVVQPVASAIQPVEVKTMPVERVVQPVENKTLEVDASSLDRRLADLRAPSRLGGDGGMNMPDHDYTGLLEGIKRAIEAGNKSKFTVV